MSSPPVVASFKTERAISPKDCILMKLVQHQDRSVPLILKYLITAGKIRVAHQGGGCVNAGEIPTGSNEARLLIKGRYDLVRRGSMK